MIGRLPETGASLVFWAALAATFTPGAGNVARITPPVAPCPTGSENTLTNSWEYSSNGCPARNAPTGIPASNPVPEFPKKSWITVCLEMNGSLLYTDSCDVGDLCLRPDGQRDVTYALKTQFSSDPRDFSLSGQKCGPPDEGPPSGPSAADVRRAFERHAWPSSTLTLDPSGGLTLVNKTTTASTTNPGPTTKNFTLLGTDITIEATPKNWTWHWADGTTETTTHPGLDGSITHAYTKAATRLAPRVDTTYTGRWRLTDGEWQTIPNTHTVTGPALTLNVHEAVIHLTR